MPRLPPVIEAARRSGPRLRDPVPELLGFFRTLGLPLLADPPELTSPAGLDSLPERFEVLSVPALTVVGLLLKLFCLVASLRREAPAERDFLDARAARRSDVLEEVVGVLELALLGVVRAGRRRTGVDAAPGSD